ncbi:MAG: transposase [Elusimicrobiota bacterium]
MGKIHRFLEKGAVHFVTTNTINRVKIFNDEVSARFLLLCIGYHKFMLNFYLLGYVIMPDHLHMLLQILSEKYNLSVIMKQIKGNFARKYNEWYQKNQPTGSRRLNADYLKWDYRGFSYKPVWQESFYDTALRDPKQVREKIEYMHWNPVKAGIVDHPKDYEFSSYHQYYGEKRLWIQIPIEKFII